MKIIKVLLLLPFFSFGQSEIDYKVFYSNNLKNEGLKVQITFNAKTAKDSTYFRYSDLVWGEKNLINCLRLIQTENSNYTFKVIPNSSRIVVYHPKARNSSFSYHIIQDMKAESPKAKNRP
ncbi:MAG TPA: peptidase, partial [Saprospiraceae bacterium]|nr:peptidase [Saprospiraceae bacterium]